MTPTPRTDAIAHRGYGQLVYISKATDLCRELEREVAVWKHEVQLLRAELESEHEKAIQLFIELQDLKHRRA